MGEEKTKTCRRCGEKRATREFRAFSVRSGWEYLGPGKYRPKYMGPYLRSWCRDCEREYSKSWRERHPGYHAQKAREYRAM